MPAKSKAQRHAAGMALAAKRGELDPRLLKGRGAGDVSVHDGGSAGALCGEHAHCPLAWRRRNLNVSL